MTRKADRLDIWIRGNFVALNSELEELYFNSENPEVVEGIGDELKEQLVEEGKALIVDLLQEGNTDEGFEAQFDLLGNVGLYMAACRRHEITEPSRETTSPLAEASALAMQLGASLGVAPRFASAHLETHNLAINGSYKTFTSLPDEELFVTCNTRSALAYIRAAEALLHIQPLGVSHPVTPDLLVAAKRALEDVITSNRELFEELDIDRFFYCVRPYYKPHRVGLREYRGRLRRHQRHRPPAGPVPGGQRLLLAAAGGQVHVHAAGGPAGPPGLHATEEPDGQLPGPRERALGGGLVQEEHGPFPAGVPGSRGHGDTTPRGAGREVHRASRRPQGPDRASGTHRQRSAPARPAQVVAQAGGPACGGGPG